MSHAERVLARRYAQAFLPLFERQVNSCDIALLCKAARIFCAHKLRLACALATYVDATVVAQRLISVCREVGMPPTCSRLVHLLIRHGRIALLPDIVMYVCMLYKQRHNMLGCVITTSYQLNAQEQELIAQYIARKTGAHLLTEYRVDTALIAGIRVVTDAYFWEYSVRSLLAESVRRGSSCI